MSSQAPLLTIAVPTYNRASYLDRCLSQIVSQSGKYGDRIELIVSDNCSTDDTESLVASYIAAGHAIQYVRNAENIGPDGNFRCCFDLARGKYFLLFSDDDVLLDGSLEKIMELLVRDEYGVVYISSYFFKSDYVEERPRRKMKGVIVYCDIESYIRRIDVWFTFISGNIVNKSLVDRKLDLGEFVGTNLLQLSWTFSSLFNSSRNVFYDEYLVAGQSENTGGYKFCEVFGAKMNLVFETFTSKYGVERRYFEIIVKKMLKKHLSKYILAARVDFGSYHEEDFLRILHPIYRPYLSYWLFVYPAIRWPLPLAKLWCKLSRFLAKRARAL